MAACTHQYARPHTACPHAAAEGASFCVWHSDRVRKHDAYVPAVLGAAERATGGDLEGFRLAGLLWPNAGLAGRCLRDADLRDAVLDGSDLGTADLTGAVLRRASLKRVVLARATLAGVDLAGANLHHADLRDADLSGADLSGASLLGCDLRGANLAGARLGEVRWNERTRLAGARGLVKATAGPLFALAQRPDAAEASSLADEDDGERSKTRAFAPAARGRSTDLRTLAAAALVAGALGLGAGTLVERSQAARIMPVEAVAIVAPPAASFQHQEAAYVARIKELETASQELLDQRDRVEQDALAAKAESQRLLAALRVAEGEAGRLRGQDDRAALASMDFERASSERDRLSGELNRQARLAAILSAGVARIEAERSALAAKITDLGEASDRAALLQVEREQARRDLAQAAGERDAQRERADRLAAELVQARDDMGRYLARISGTGLEDYLATDIERLALVPVAPGSTVALGGDYTITLRLDAGSKAGVVNAALTLQRPAALATPDVAIVLYDKDRQPLRRIAYSFPHIDAGTPFAAATTSIACDRFPAFARVLVAPDVTTARR